MQPQWTQRILILWTTVTRFEFSRAAVNHADQGGARRTVHMSPAMQVLAAPAPMFKHARIPAPRPAVTPRRRSSPRCWRASCRGA